MKMRLDATTIVFGLLLLMCYQSIAARSVETVIDRDTLITSSIEIPESVSCTIRPGVTVRFADYYRFVVRGLLVAQGTARQPIVFTGENRPRGSNEKPSWQGFEIAGPAGSAVFSHCRIEGAYSNIVWGSAVSFDSCEFAGNHYALYCMRKSTPHINASRFYRNVFGLTIEGATPLVYNSSITDNTVGVYLLFNAPLCSGKNSIQNNGTDIKTDASLGAANESFSLHYMWNLMRELY